MKQFVKKFLCVMLSIILLSSNVQVFAQEVPGGVLADVYKIEDDINKLSDIYECLYQETTAVFYGTEGIHSTVMNEGWSEMASFRANYQEFQPVVKEYLEVSEEYLKEMRYYVDDIEILYTQFAEEVFDNSIPELVNGYREFMVDFADRLNHLSEIKYFEEGLPNLRSLHNFSIKYGKQFVENKETAGYVIDALQQVYSDRQALAIFKGNTFISKNMEIGKLLEEFSTHVPDEQAKVIISLIASDESVTTTNLINYLSKFFNKFNNKMARVKYLSPANLEKVLMKMSTHERAEFVNNVLNVSQEDRILAKQIRSAEQAGGKKLVSRERFFKGGSIIAPLIIITSIFIAFNITEMYAANSYSANNNTDLRTLEENGEMSLLDMLQYLEPRNRYLLADRPDILMWLLKDLTELDENLDAITTALEEEQTTTETQEGESLINRSLNNENILRVQDTLIQRYSPAK